MIKKLTLAVLLACSSMLSAQTVNPTTGEVQVTSNVIDPNAWTNVIRMNGTQLSQVEGTGGGPVPAYNTDTNTIRFSFMPYTVSQIRAIDQVLSGQGISVTGFNYSWKIYNDLNNCCGTRGSLFVNGSLTNKSGNVVESYFYDYSLTNTGAAFQTFTGTETFNNPYQLNSLGDISISWTGSDMNFWSGYYGPRVRDTSITLNYTVKPATQSSPTVPTTDTTSTTTAELISAASQPTVQETVISQPTSTTVAEVTVQTPTTNTTTSTTPTSANPVATVATVAPVAPVVTNTQTVSQATQQSNSSTTNSSSPSISLALSTIRSNERREQAIVATAVASANEAAQNAVQSAEQTAMTVAATSSASSMSNVTRVEQQSTPITQTTNSSTPTIASNNPTVLSSSNNQPVQLIGTTPTVARTTSTQSTTNNESTSVNLSLVNRPQTVNTQQSNIQQTVVDSSISIVQGPALIETPKPTTQVAVVEMRNMQDNDLVVFSNNFLTNRANPLTEIVENNTRPTNNTVEQKETTLNRNAVNNELAGGVQLERMAVLPVGYNSYLQLALRDAAFYAPKEIYRNQRVIDNQQAVRLLNFASDLKHQQMVNQQYGERK